VDGAFTGLAPDGATVVTFTDTPGDLRSFDEVVIIDYPWSMETLEAAVGAAGDETGPGRVSCLHTPGSIDDRLALMSARRRELSGNGTGPPDEEETRYLLTPRDDSRTTPAGPRTLVPSGVIRPMIGHSAPGAHTRKPLNGDNSPLV
jgi:hypothetical protein